MHTQGSPVEFSLCAALSFPRLTLRAGAGAVLPDAQFCLPDLGAAGPAAGPINVLRVTVGLTLSVFLMT